MSKKTQSAFRNQMDHTGAPSGIPINYLNALAKVFLTLSNTRELCIWLTLWLIGALPNYNTQNKPLPRFKRISANQPCEAHCFRLISHSDFTSSYVEYAQPYKQNGSDKVHYWWQPIPTCFNPLFLNVLRSINNGSYVLTIKQCEHLTHYLCHKQKRPKALQHDPMHRKDTLALYFSKQARLRTDVTHHVKATMQPNHRLLHKSALSYLSEDSDSIRFGIYRIQSILLNELWELVALHSHRKYFKITLKGGAHFHCCDPIKDHLLTPSSLPSLPVFNRLSGTHTCVPIPKIYLGSSRNIDVSELQRFFTTLHQTGLRLYPGKKADLKRHCDYYNWITYELVLQYEALTGHRPTHNLFTAQNSKFQHIAIINDKGKAREIFLNAFISQQILHYQGYQATLMRNLGIAPTSTSSPIALLITEQYQLRPLVAKDLNLFVKKHLSPNNNAYILRHHFSQFAQKNIVNNGLPSPLHDHIMGHSNAGEHLDNHMRFPIHNTAIFQHLDQLTQYLQLKGFCHDKL